MPLMTTVKSAPEATIRTKKPKLRARNALMAGPLPDLCLETAFIAVVSDIIKLPAFLITCMTL